MSRLVLDLSSNDIGLTDPACLKANGVDGVVLGVFSRGNPPHDMVALGDACVAAGVPVLATYGLPYFGADGGGVLRDSRWACDVAAHFGVTDVWMDVEADACDNGWSVGRPSPGQRIQELLEVRRFIEGRGFRPGVYSYAPFWKSQMANTGLFSDLRFWLAAYGMGGFPIDPITTVGFGGWVNLAAHQYTDRWGEIPPYSEANPRCGRAKRDANYWYEEEEMPDPRVDAIIAALTGLSGEAANERLSKWNYDVMGGPTGNSLLDGYTEEQQKVAVLALRAAGAITDGMSGDEVRALVAEELRKARIVLGG